MSERHNPLLHMLYSGTTTGYFTIWAKHKDGPKVTHWYDLSMGTESIQQATTKALELDTQGYDVYVSTGPAHTKGKSNTRISHEMASSVPAFFMDCDVGKVNCPTSKEELRDKLLALPVPPRIVIDSGGGYHAYWPLSVPISITNKQELATAKKQLRGFADGIAAQLGWTGFDTFASEPAHVLRVPGTHNYKQDTPAPVDVAYLSELPPYKLDELTPYIAAKAPKQAVALPPARTAPANLDDQQILTKMRTGRHGERLTRLWNGQWEGDYPSQSEADIALCNGFAFYTHGDAARMESLFRQSGLFRADKWEKMHGVQTYGQMTINKSLDTTTTFYDPQRATEYSNAAPSPFDRFTRAYEMVGGYASKKGVMLAESIDQNGEIIKKPLANFTALIADETTRDDGVETRKEFVLEGITATGKPLPAISVPANRFTSMSWVIDCWGADANLSPGTTIKDKLRYAIQAASAPLLKRSTVYTHAGWRVINGKTAFLYHDGAVGIDGVSVELGGSLSMYSLPSSTGDVKEAATASMEMLNVLPPRIAIPLLAHMYLAPLTEPLDSAGVPPGHVLFLAGRSGTGKSTSVALALNHFGAKFSHKRMPASFNDTANAVQGKAFELKDMPLLVDDFCPMPNAIEQRRRATIAHQLIRAWGDRAERGRMRSDGTIEKARPPRGIGMMTGEDAPSSGNESGTARLFMIDVKPGEIHKGPALTALQNKAYAGYLARAMRGYIEWLIPKYDSLPDTLAALFIEYRGMAQEKLAGAHDRQPEAAAWLLVGFHMALEYWKNAGVLDDTAALWAQAQDVLFAHSEAQQQAIKDENPVSMFLYALQEMHVTSEVEVHRIGEPIPTLGGEQRIGFCDDTFIYLLNGVVFAKVEGHYKAQGLGFPISQPQLWKRLADEGIIETWGNTTSKQKYIRGVGSPRCVWVRKASVPMLFNKDPDTGAFEV